MNILINGKCSKACKFCFQHQYFRRQPNMPLAMFKDILDWLVKSYYTKNAVVPFSILGGEPMIHPEFTNIIDYVIHKQSTTPRAVLQVCLITNGDGIGRHAPTLARVKNLALLLNVSSMNSDRELLNKIRIMSQHNLCVVPSLTVSHSSILEKLDFLFRALPHGKMYRVSFASDKRRTSFRYYQDNRKYLLEAYRHLTKNDKVIIMDCTKIPRCAFTEEERQELHSFTVRIDGANWFGAACPQAGDIMPDGSIVHCVPLYDLTSRELKYHHFDNCLQAFSYTSRMIGDRIQEKMRNAKKCKACLEYKTGRCYAGCLAMDAVP